MDVAKLDHVALRVHDPERAAAQLLGRLPFRVLQRTDELLLLGRSPELGKVTLLPDPEAGRAELLHHVAIRVPAATAITEVTLDEELDIRLVPGDVDGDVELDHVALAVDDAVASAEAWRSYELATHDVEPGLQRVRIADAHIELVSGDNARDRRRGVLDHVGLLVTSIRDAQDLAARQGLTVDRVVDADNSRALFVRGPDGVEIEYIEHKASFALA